MTPRRIAVIDGHPDPDSARFVHALSRTYCERATAAGHEIRRLDVATMEFDLVRTSEEWQGGAASPDIIGAQKAIEWAEHVAVFYPLWLGDLPALFKAFLEQVMRPGFAFEPSANGLPVKKLKGKTAHIVVTMGMPALFYRAYFGAHSLKSLERNILKFTGIVPVQRTIIGGVEGGEAHRRHWLDTIGKAGESGF